MKQVWICSACTFENKGSKSICQMCDKSKKQSIKQSKLRENEQKGISKSKECVACSFINENHQIECSICGNNLKKQNYHEQGFQQEQPKIMQQQRQEQNKYDVIKCSSCNEENDPINKICVFCDESLQKNTFSDLVSLCNFCNLPITKTRLRSHKAVCQKSQKFLKQEQNKKNMTCPYCWNKYDPKIIRKHANKCQEKVNIFKDKKKFGRLTALQLKTIQFMHQQCQSQHFDKVEELKQRIKGFGYTQEDLDNLHHYIANYAPIIIHINAYNNMKHFISDTHYRNIFQVTKQAQTCREQWEDRMFYALHHDASFYERVKYGTINFTNDPNGVEACFSYGSSHLLLKEAVRDRCTFTDMDSASDSATIGTFRLCFHVLLKLDDKQLKGAFQASKATEVSSKGIINSYKQIQIHGPVEFKEDIQGFYMNRAEIDMDDELQQQLKQFSQRNNVEYQIFDSKQIKKQASLFSKKKSGVWKQKTTTKKNYKK